MKKTLLFTILFLFILLPVFSVNYSGGVKVGFGKSILKNQSLNFEDDLRDALRCEITLEPACFIISNFDIGCYIQIVYQGDSSIINYTKIIGYSSLSLGLQSKYYITKSYSLGLMLGTGYLLTKELYIGSAFLEFLISNSYFITKNVALSLDLGVRYKKERFEFPIVFSLTYKPFVKEHWYAITTYFNFYIIYIMFIKQL